MLANAVMIVCAQQYQYVLFIAYRSVTRGCKRTAYCGWHLALAPCSSHLLLLSLLIQPTTLAKGTSRRHEGRKESKKGLNSVNLT